MGFNSGFKGLIQKIFEYDWGIAGKSVELYNDNKDKNIDK